MGLEQWARLFRVGIRQGDPVSPYLFILCAEGLSALLKKYAANKWLHGVKICRKAPVITHMLFADDCYLYCKTNEGEAIRLLEMLERFEKATWQKVNSAKSSVFFSTNTSVSNRNSVCEVLNMVEADERNKYLGLPCILGRKKSSLLGCLKEKVTKRIQSWEGRWNFNGGKEILIKSVAQTLPNYAMNFFLLPVEITKDIERTLAKYWWNSNSIQQSSIHWMSWSRLCSHKMSGGMGIRDLRDFNMAMLGKQG